MIFKTKDFILRPIKISDAQKYFEMMQDSETQKGFMSTPKTITDVQKEIEGYLSGMSAKVQTDDMFAIEVNGVFAGYVHINELNKEHFKHRANIGYAIHPNYRGKGITTKAVKIVSDYAFKKYKLKRLEGWCRTFNKASARVLEKSGFKLEGILRKNKCKDGKYLDDMIWAKVK